LMVANSGERIGGLCVVTAGARSAGWILRKLVSIRIGAVLCFLEVAGVYNRQQCRLEIAGNTDARVEVVARGAEARAAWTMHPLVVMCLAHD
jgi:hypothetical protein